MLVHWFPSTQVDSRTRGSSPSPLQAGQDVVHLVPEGMSVSYGLRSPSHVQEEYLTPARLSLIPSRALQEHLGGPEAQLSPTEHLVALRSYNLKTLTKKVPSKTYYGNVYAIITYTYVGELLGLPERQLSTTLHRVALTHRAVLDTDKALLVLPCARGQEAALRGTTMA